MNVLLENLGLYGSAFVGTIELFLVAAVGSLVVGTLLAAMRVSPVPILRTFGAGYVNIVRNTPLTLVFFFFAFAYPRLEIVDISFFARACVALIVYTSAFVCEVVRSGVNTVPVGQAEASRALGFTFGQTLGAVVLPQALRAVVPPLTSRSRCSRTPRSPPGSPCSRRAGSTRTCPRGATTCSSGCCGWPWAS